MTSNWTLGDLAMMTHQEMQIAQQQLAMQDQLELFCEWCTIVSVAYGERYCAHCIQVLTDDMAVEYQEQQACDNALL